MKTLTKHMNWDSIIKSLYGIEGELDEYRRQRIGDLTSRVFLIQQAYLLFSPLLFLIWKESNLKSAFIFALLGQLALVLFSHVYISRKLEQDGITILEVDPEQFKSIKKKLLRRRGVEAIIFFLLIHLTSPLYPWVKESFWSYITSGDHIFGNLFETFIIWRISVYYTKKHLQKLPEQEA